MSSNYSTSSAILKFTKGRWYVVDWDRRTPLAHPTVERSEIQVSEKNLQFLTLSRRAHLSPKTKIYQ